LEPAQIEYEINQCAAGAVRRLHVISMPSIRRICGNAGEEEWILVLELNASNERAVLCGSRQAIPAVFLRQKEPLNAG